MSAARAAPGAGAAVPVAGVVLAAGRSSRMGRPKPLLSVAGRSFLRTAVDALRAGGCEPIIVVVPHSEEPDAALIAAEAAASGVSALHASEPDGEQIDSLRTALASLPAGVAAALVHPVDVPGIAPSTVRALLDAFRSAGRLIVLPVAGGRRGHPTLFARAVWPELMAPGLREGARTVVEADTDRVAEVSIDDAAALADVDTPADLAALRRGPDDV